MSAGVTVTPALAPDRGARELGGLAAWTVSSAKPGNGVELLRDGRGDTYWQSDGAQPHVVELAFQRRVALSALAVALDFRLDESYTPARLSVRAGSRWSDLVEVTAADLAEPQGWVTIPLAAPGGGPVRARLLQLVVVSNHQNGRDTHVRQVRAFGPRDAGARAAAGGALELATGQFRVFATLADDVSPPGAAGDPGVLATFFSQNAPAYLGLAPAARRAAVLASFASWFGAAAAAPLEFVEKDWPADPYAGGAYAGIFLPGAWTSVGAALATPVGRLHWAGTEASARWPGFIEGVLQAGADAAAAVGAALDVEG